MVFPDHHPNHFKKGGRFLFGRITDVFNNIITVEITAENSDIRWKKHDQIFFQKFQVWPWAEPGIQLSLFDR